MENIIYILYIMSSKLLPPSESENGKKSFRRWISSPLQAPISLPLLCKVEEEGSERSPGRQESLEERQERPPRSLLENSGGNYGKYKTI